MSAAKAKYLDSSFLSIHYIICECGETFPSETGLRAHLQNEHPHKRERKEFKCGLCGLVFSTEQGCISHYEAEHFSDSDIKQEQDEQEDKFNVPEEIGGEQEIEHQIVFQVDNQDSEIPQQYTAEYLEHLTDQEFNEGTKETELVSQDELTQGEMSREILTQEDLLKEEISENDTISETTLATQILMKENGNKKYVQVQAPPLKMVRDVDTGQLVLVFNRARPTKRQADKRQAAKPKVSRDIVCEVCGRKYASNAALRYHQRKHTGEKPYPCHLCPKKFTMPLFLQIHVRTHTGERPYQCPDCPKAFSNKAALLRHERVHTGEKPYVCPMCQKAFTQSNSMKLHVATVHLKQPAPYKSKARRLKEAARGIKPTVNKIKAFAPSASSTSPQPDSTQSDAEYEVVISEEVQEPDDGTSYEIIYTEE